MYFSLNFIKQLNDFWVTITVMWRHDIGRQVPSLLRNRLHFYPEY
jgi:hypothetical protein